MRVGSFIGCRAPTLRLRQEDGPGLSRATHGRRVEERKAGRPLVLDAQEGRQAASTWLLASPHACRALDSRAPPGSRAGRSRREDARSDRRRCRQREGDPGDADAGPAAVRVELPAVPRGRSRGRGQRTRRRRMHTKGADGRRYEPMEIRRALTATAMVAVLVLAAPGAGGRGATGSSGLLRRRAKSRPERR